MKIINRIKKPGIELRKEKKYRSTALEAKWFSRKLLTVLRKGIF